MPAPSASAGAGVELRGRGPSCGAGGELRAAGAADEGLPTAGCWS
ncbi:hypothetical protein [Ornithinimicrobium cerasi]|nr:hypothetical protein [Ornithinimicrobium cerasi]